MSLVIATEASKKSREQSNKLYSLDTLTFNVGQLIHDACVNGKFKESVNVEDCKTEIVEEMADLLEKHGYETTFDEVRLYFSWESSDT